MISSSDLDRPMFCQVRFGKPGFPAGISMLHAQGGLTGLERGNVEANEGPDSTALVGEGDGSTLESKTSTFDFEFCD